MAGNSTEINLNFNDIETGHSGIIYGIICSAARLAEVANYCRTVVYHISVAGVHATRDISVGKYNFFVALREKCGVSDFVSVWKFFGLAGVRYAGNKTDFGTVLFAQFYYCFASKEVETHGHAAVKRIEPALYKSENNSFKQFAVKIAAEQSVAAERTAVFPQIILPHFSYLFRFSYLYQKILLQKTHKKTNCPAHMCQPYKNFAAKTCAAPRLHLQIRCGTHRGGTYIFNMRDNYCASTMF